MAEVMTAETAREMVDEMEAHYADTLTEWETSFCNSIYNSKYERLTEKQTACLKKIYNRVTDNGRKTW